MCHVGGSLDQETLSCSERGCALFQRRDLEDLAPEHGASALGGCCNVFAPAFCLLSSLISCTRRRAHRFGMIKVRDSTARGAHPGHVHLGVNLDLKPFYEVRRHRRTSVESFERRSSVDEISSKRTRRFINISMAYWIRIPPQSIRRTAWLVSQIVQLLLQFFFQIRARIAA
jgi:hypothetical protein